tara:strand:+ start:2595 stop:2765 length:171 start_codon:yes stop_codon:yes gene_type:complete
MDNNKIKNIVCLLLLVLIYRAGIAQSAEEVKIGEQIWKIYNLNIEKFRNSDAILDA